jgi:uroporphyrinogen-III decarboxylase
MVSDHLRGVKGSMLCTGTPEQVKADVKELIDLFKDKGGLIIDATNGLPDETRPENMSAMTEAVMEYGIYD